MDCFVARAPRNDAEHGNMGDRNDIETWVLILAARSARGLLLFPPSSNRGRGDAGRSVRPVAACAMSSNCAHALAGHTGITRHSPRNVLRIITLSLIHISEPTRQAEISYAVFCLK